MNGTTRRMDKLYRLLRDDGVGAQGIQGEAGGRTAGRHRHLGGGDTSAISWQTGDRFFALSRRLRGLR